MLRWFLSRPREQKAHRVGGMIDVRSTASRNTNEKTHRSLYSQMKTDREAELLVKYSYGFH